MKIRSLVSLTAVLSVLVFSGCGKSHSHSHEASAGGGHSHKHEHTPPHGGTPVVLGNELYHLELVVDAASGKLSAYVFDGELENFIRTAVPGLEIEASVGGEKRLLTLAAIPNPATGETVGDTSLFEGQADWLKTTKEFDATLRTITIRGTAFTDVKFNFPKGNDHE